MTGDELPSNARGSPSGDHSVLWLQRLAAVAWAGYALAVLSLWLQFRFNVYHTHAWLWVPQAAAGLIAGLGTLFLGSVKVLLGPSRRAAGKWLTIANLPVALWMILAGDMIYEQSQRNLPNTQAHKVGRMAAVTLFELHARQAYPHRLETARLVMHYDDRITNAADDAAAMDAHLLRLEEILGRKQHSPIHWVRGSALEMNSMCIHSIALGSASSPAGTLNRHELAHAFLYQFSRPESEPPMLLLEGWAMSVDGHGEPLNMTARAVHDSGKRTLGDILRPDDYHRGTPEAYLVGGALVQHLIRSHGAERFLEFYNGCHPDSYEADFERAYGTSFQEMESAFWKAME